MRLIRSLALCAVLSAVAYAQAPIFDPAAYAPYETMAVSLRQAIRSNFGIHATGSDYATRKLISDSMDQAMAWQTGPNGETLYHPFLYPEISCFMRTFMLESLNEMIAEMDADAANPQAVGVKTWYSGENGVLFQVMLPIGPGGSLKPFRVMYDFSDIFFDFSNLIAPGCTPNSDFDAVVQQIAQRIDIQCISHIHPDHTSARLVYAMQALGKPIVMPSTILGLAQLMGLNTANFFVVPQGVYPLGPFITLSVFDGSQIITYANGAPTDYVENKVHIFSFNVPVDGSPNDGVSVMHFGDNGDPLLFPYLGALTGAGVIKPHVVSANGLAATTTWSANIRIGCPVFEITHPAWANSFMNMPLEGQTNPAFWMPLFWGESIRYPQDLPL